MKSQTINMAFKKKKKNPAWLVSTESTAVLKNTLSTSLRICYWGKEEKKKNSKRKKTVEYWQSVCVCVWESTKAWRQTGRRDKEVLRCAISPFSFCFCIFLPLCFRYNALEEKKTKPDPVSSVVCPVWCHFLSCSNHAVLSVRAITVLKEKREEVRRILNITGSGTTQTFLWWCYNYNLDKLLIYS